MTGVAALVWSQFPSCTPARIRTALTATAQDRGTAGRDVYYGFGIVRAQNAVSYLQTNGC
ncbi:MAG: S8 family serine peptidase [Rheinheimera sp.]|nr:S8 family serine peptidase [Rheinheimera sp.]